jgi:hypothetical protein
MGSNLEGGTRSEVLLHTADDVRILVPQRRSVFQHATTQKKRSEGSGVGTLIERRREHDRVCNDDWVDGWLLDLAGQEQCYDAVVMIIVCIMMDKLMQAWTDCQDRSPLKHRHQKQRDNLLSGGPNGVHSGAGPLVAVFPEYDAVRHDGRWLDATEGSNMVSRSGLFRVTN